MNEKYIRYFEKSGLSMYELAREAGLPYTTINELNRGKLDINHCSVRYVSRLADIFGVTVEELINPSSYMDGVGGKYRNIRYTWKKKDRMVLSFVYKKKPVELDSGLRMMVPGRREAYSLMGELLIDQFLRKLESEEKAEKLIREYLHG